jgi:hypothetical protein
MPAGDRFVEVPAELLAKFLESKGFERGVFGREVVYRRRHDKDPSFVVCVYTSISANGATQARGLGQDAIRVTAYQELSPDGTSTRGVAKCQRVYRTGTVQGVLERTYGRMREAYAVCNQRIAGDAHRRVWGQR